MNKQLLFFFLACCCYFTGRSQTTCNPNGNLVIFTNYDGGILNINVDVNIPNLKIAVCSYEAVTINLSGAYVNNVTAVRYAGYNSSPSTHCVASPGIATTTINGAPVGATTNITVSPPAPFYNPPNGNANIICGYNCSTTGTGGCNTMDQIEAYFLAQFPGSIIRMNKGQYGCWSGTYAISAGGNCCMTAPPPLPLSVNITSVPPTCFGGCNGSATATATGGTPPYSYQWTGGPNTATWTNRCAGTYTVVVTDAATPVPAAVTQTVTITAPPQKGSTVTQTACKSYNFNSQVLTASGTYKDTLVASNNCDSIVTLNLTVNNANVNVNQAGSVLTAVASGATYQWVNCDSNKKPIAGAVSQSFTAPKTGNYAVIVTQNGCTDTSACKSVTVSGGIQQHHTASFSVYPNPAGEEMTIEATAAVMGHDYTITDQSGRVVLKGVLNHTRNAVSLKTLTAGMYMLHVTGVQEAVKVEKY